MFDVSTGASIDTLSTVFGTVILTGAGVGTTGKGVGVLFTTVVGVTLVIVAVLLVSADATSVPDPSFYV